MFIGTFLKNCRDLAGLTQRQVSKLTSINSKTISNWENNVSNPSPHDLILLSKAYSRSIDELVGNEYAPKKVYDFTKDEVEIIRKYRSISQDNKTALITLLNVFYDTVKPKLGKSIAS